MKKLIFSFVIFFAVMANAQPVFNEVYQEVLRLNADRFANVNRIQIGDTVLFPSLTGAGTEFLIADSPENGVHDCLYRMTGKYINGQLPTQPVPSVITTPEPVVIESAFVNYDFWIWFIIISLMLLVIAAYLLNHFRPWNNRRDLDRRPVISGGLSSNPAEAASQLSVLTSGSRVVKSERGRLICASPVKVKMNFSDGVKKVTLISGEEYYRITENNGNVRYARRACGNLVTGSISTLPEEVTFVPSTEENSSWAETATENIVATTEPKSEVEESVKDSNLEQLSKVLEVAGKMVNAPAKITFNGLVIEFAPVVEKEEDKDK